MNLPSSGPDFPIGAPGVRLAVTPVEWFTFQTAVFEGDVFAQNVNRTGFRWRLNQKFGAFWMNEAQFRWNHAEDAKGLPGQFKLGAWFHSADFAAPFGDNTYWGDSGYYGIIDHMLSREPREEVSA